MQPFGTGWETVTGTAGGIPGYPVFGLTGLSSWQLGVPLILVRDLLEDARFDLLCAECPTWRGSAAEAAFEFRTGLLEQLGDLQLLLEQALAIAGGN